MANIIFAACDGKEGNPGEYRDYRLKRLDSSFVSGHRFGNAASSLSSNAPLGAAR